MTTPPAGAVTGLAPEAIPASAYIDAILRFETALARAQASLQLIPREAAASIAAAASGFRPRYPGHWCGGLGCGHAGCRAARPVRIASGRTRSGCPCLSPSRRDIAGCARYRHGAVPRASRVESTRGAQREQKRGYPPRQGPRPEPDAGAHAAAGRRRDHVRIQGGAVECCARAVGTPAPRRQ